MYEVITQLKSVAVCLHAQLHILPEQLQELQRKKSKLLLEIKSRCRCTQTVEKHTHCCKWRHKLVIARSYTWPLKAFTQQAMSVHLK